MSVLSPLPDLWTFVETRCAVCSQPECRCKAEPRRIEFCSCGTHFELEYGWERRSYEAHVASECHQAWRIANPM